MTVEKRGLFASLFFVLVALLPGCGKDAAIAAFERGEELREAGRYSEALERYGYVALHHGESAVAPDALYRMGEINYLYLSDFDSAVDAFRRLIAKYLWSDRCPRAQSYLADIYMYKLHDYKQAIIEYQKAILYYGTKRESERFQYEIAEAYFNLKNFEQQRVEINLLLNRFPDTELKREALIKLANSYNVEGKLDEAVKGYKRIIESYPDTAVALEATFQLAASLEEKEDLRGALKLLKEIRGVYPNPKIVRLRMERIEKRLKKKRR